MAECVDFPCARALTQPRRLGRAHWVCPDCNRDVSLHLLLLAAADLDIDPSPAGRGQAEGPDRASPVPEEAAHA